MPDQKSEWNDVRVENIIGELLRAGVAISASLVLLGGIIYLFRHGIAPAAYARFHGEPARYRSVTGVLAGLRHPGGRGVIQLGLLLLIATPVARVAFSVWAFAKERDRTYVVITLIVLAILLYSLAGTR